MNRIVRQATFWTPRVICVLFAVFLVVFSFDVFREEHGFRDLALGLLVHNLPTIGLFATLYVAWRREWIGSVVFLGLGLLYLVAFWGRFPALTYVVISGPLFLLGVLFLVNWVYRTELRSS